MAREAKGEIRKIGAERPPADARRLVAWIAPSVVAVGATIAAVWWYSWLLFSPDDVRTKFGELGDAVAPLGALATMFALFAALWSVHLQRKELEENRAELRRTADAQEKLARVQDALMIAQVAANRLSMHMEEAQRTATLASLMGHLVQFEDKRMMTPLLYGGGGADASERLLALVEEMRVQMSHQIDHIQALRNFVEPHKVGTTVELDEPSKEGEPDAS